MRLVVVDENDNVIGTKEREEITPKDFYRVSALWLTNSKGEVLMSKRSMKKKVDPGKWGPAVAGTVEESETYESNIHKETEEELGLTGLQMTLGPKRKRVGERSYFGQWFLATMDIDPNDLKIQAEEVDEVKWFSVEEIKLLMQADTNAFVPSMQENLKFILEFLNNR